MAIITVIEDGRPVRIDTTESYGYVEAFLSRLAQDYVYRSLLNSYLRGNKDLTEEEKERAALLVEQISAEENIPVPEEAVVEVDSAKVNVYSEAMADALDIPDNFRDTFVDWMSEAAQGNAQNLYNVDKDLANFIVGMFVEANIITDSKKGLGLPNEAIVSEDKNNYVLVLDETTTDGYQFKKLKVNIGQQDENATEILNPDILQNQQILVKGIGMLLEESGEGGHSH